MRVVVTGGAGFIGSALIRQLCSSKDFDVLNIDKLTYSGSLLSLENLKPRGSYSFVKADIADRSRISETFEKFKPDWVMHLAAESHVDRSIDGPEDFIQTNIVGTYRLLECARDYFEKLTGQKKKTFRFLHVSTDEVYGSLTASGIFREHSAYDPHSPYSASKAASDHLASAWHHTYGLPVLVTNSCNNFGAYQFPEKLIPVVILNAIHELAIPIYGKGQNVRDWIFVDDHARALRAVIENGTVGEKYLVGARNEVANIDLVRTICRHLDELCPRGGKKKYAELISFVEDRPGHDFRYALDPQKIETELGWRAKYSFDEALRSTIKWYLENREWCEKVSGRQFSERLGKKRSAKV
jgi:dTDP-glucose 4,6-dehydratase